MREWIVIGALVGVLCASQAWPQTPNYRWSSIKMPGAVDTVASATNDASWVVGHYVERRPGGGSSAFRYQKGRFTPFAVPGAAFTEPLDIGAKSVIVGMYGLPCVPCSDGSVDLFGFVYEHTKAGLITTLQYPAPDVFWTIPEAVNNAGLVAGWWAGDRDGQTVWGNFLYDPQTGAYQDVDVSDGVLLTPT